MTRSVALAPTLLVALLANAPNQLDVLNQWLNILQSIQLPFAIIPVRCSIDDRAAMCHLIATLCAGRTRNCMYDLPQLLCLRQIVTPSAC